MITRIINSNLANNNLIKNSLVKNVGKFFSTKLWGGRFSKETNESIVSWADSTEIDTNMVREDIWGSIAHVSMLGRQKIIPHKDSIKSKVTPLYFLEDTISEPLFISKQNNKLECFSNVCTHRGNILCSKPSNNRTVKCSYHGRTFDLNGKMKHMPGFEEVKNFPTDNDDLYSLKLLDWKNFIFCSLSKGFYIQDILNDISKRIYNSWNEYREKSKKISKYYDLGFLEARKNYSSTDK